MKIVNVLFCLYLLHNNVFANDQGCSTSGKGLLTSTTTQNKTIVKRPSGISMNTKESLEEELELAGKIFSRGMRLPSFSRRGSILYLIDQNTNLVISYRAPLSQDFTNHTLTHSPPGQYLATHRSLYRQLEQFHKQSLQPAPSIIAAGELRIENSGMIVQFNNRSGTFHGNAKSLEFAIEVFREFGVNLPQNTNKIDFGQPPISTHGDAALRARASLLVHSDEVFGIFVNVLEKLYFNFVKLSKPEKVGVINLDSLYHVLADKNIVVNGDEAGYAIVLLSGIQKDGVEYTAFAQHLNDNLLGAISSLNQLKKLYESR
ncbi:MAG: hypothetical protein ISR65_15900 [Bacteriovoracaceae bacterium]|nr:hypothetical protein [Bacteriovoracaceae bacterium]